jgi:hypothetical protein
MPPKLLGSFVDPEASVPAAAVMATPSMERRTHGSDDGAAGAPAEAAAAGGVRLVFTVNSSSVAGAQSRQSIASFEWTPRELRPPEAAVPLPS